MTDLHTRIELEALITERDALNAELKSMEAHDRSAHANSTGVYAESAYMTIVHSLASVAENIRSLNNSVTTKEFHDKPSFYPGQTVMVRDTDEGGWIKGFFDCMKDGKVRCETNGGLTTWRQWRAPTKADLPNLGEATK
jgi:hypothetical protein